MFLDSAKKRCDRKLIIALGLLLVLSLASSCAHFSKPAVYTEGDRVAEFALRQLNRPYRYGGATPAGFDCSGLVYYVYGQHGYILPRTAGEQMRSGVKVKKRKLKPGDLVFFRMSWKGDLHTGIYIGDGRFVHAPKEGGTVEVARLDVGYFEDKYKTARRIIP